MLKQLIITLVVAVIVVILARARRNRAASRPASQPGRTSARASEPGSRSTAVIAGYWLAAVMVLATAGITWMRYQESNEIVRVEVIDSRSGDRTVYQVRRKHLGERDFTTVDGRVVSLGASDRMERVE